MILDVEAKKKEGNHSKFWISLLSRKIPNSLGGIRTGRTIMRPASNSLVLDAFFLIQINTVISSCELASSEILFGHSAFFSSP